MIWSLTEFIRRLFSSKKRPAPPRTARNAHPELEELGPRIMPATRIWTGMAPDNNASSAANWNSPPVSWEGLTFDGTVSNKSAVIDPAFLSSVGNIIIQGGYAGTISISQAINQLFSATQLTQPSGSVIVNSPFQVGQITESNGTMVINAALTAGAVNESGGTITISAGDTLTVQQMYTLTGGKLSGPGSLLFSSNFATSMMISGGAFDGELQARFATNTSVTISADTEWTSTTITNDGTMSWMGGDIDGTTGTLQNYGTLNIRCDKPFRNFGTFALINYGTLRKTDTPGTTTLDAALSDLEIPGGPQPTVIVGNGTLEVGSSGEHQGSFTASGNARLLLHNQQTFISDTSLFGTGTIEFGNTMVIDQGVTVESWGLLKQTGGIIQGGGSLINTGRMEWSDGLIRDLQLFENRGVLELQGNTTNILRNITLVNRSVVNWPSLGNLKLMGAGIDNQGTFDIQNDAKLEAGEGVNAFVNQATVTKTGGIGVTDINVPFSNLGTFLLNGKLIDFNAGYSQTGVAAVTRLGGGTLHVVGWCDIVNGYLSGQGTIDGNLRLNGTLDFGPTIGNLSVTGNYQQTINGRIIVKIAGNGPTNCDWLSVVGNATLSGGVSVQLINPYMPVAGDTSRFLLCAGTLNGLLNSPPNWTVLGDATGLTLNF